MQIMTSSGGVIRPQSPLPPSLGEFGNGNKNKIDLFILTIKTLLTRRETDIQSRWIWMGSWEGGGGLGPSRFYVGKILITCEITQMNGNTLRVTGVNRNVNISESVFINILIWESGAKWAISRTYSD